MTPTQIKITDRNEAKFLLALGFSGTPSPRDSTALDFAFEATEELFEARRAYSLNHSCPIQSFICSSRFVDKAIHMYRQSQGVHHGKQQP